MTPPRWAWAEIDLDAIGHNVEVLRRAVAPAAVWAVVKADGYGHGAVRTAKRALQAGAEALCVALVDEGIELRQAGIDVPILLLAEQPADRSDDVVGYRLTPTVYSRPSIDQLAAAAVGGFAGLAVHVNVDTGMQRVGVSVDEAPAIVRYAADHAPAIELAGVYTHLACADEPTSSASAEQLERFDRVLAELDAGGLCPPLVHVANSAGGAGDPGDTPFAGSCRHRDLRHLARSRCRSPRGRTAAGAGAQGAPVVCQAGGRRQLDLVRMAAPF